MLSIEIKPNKMAVCECKCGNILKITRSTAASRRNTHHLFIDPELNFRITRENFNPDSLEDYIGIKAQNPHIKIRRKKTDEKK